MSRKLDKLNMTVNFEAADGPQGVAVWSNEDRRWTMTGDFTQTDLKLLGQIHGSIYSLHKWTPSPEKETVR